MMIDIYEKGCQAEQLALWTIRGARRSTGSAFGVWMSGHHDHWRDLQSVSSLFSRIDHDFRVRRGSGLDIAPVSQIWMTVEERQWLRTTAAAQTDDDAVLAECAAILSPHATLTPTIADAAAQLGATLAIHGYWLPKPEIGSCNLPCAALSVARHRAPGWDHVHIMWP